MMTEIAITLYMLGAALAWMIDQDVGSRNDADRIAGAAMVICWPLVVVILLIWRLTEWRQ